MIVLHILGILFKILGIILLALLVLILVFFSYFIVCAGALSSRDLARWKRAEGEGAGKLPAARCAGIRLF